MGIAGKESRGYGRVHIGQGFGGRNELGRYFIGICITI